MFRHAGVHQYLSVMEKDWQKFFKPSLDDTYFIVFGPENEGQLELFHALAKRDNVSILYQAPKAINYNYDNVPRNTLVIFEFNELPKRAVSKVSK